MSGSSSSALLLSVSALLLATTTAATAAGGGNFDMQRITQDASVAFQSVAIPSRTTVVMVTGKSSYGGENREVSTDQGDFSVSQSFSRLAFRAQQTYDTLHGGCTYAVTHNGPRAELPQGDSHSVFRVFEPNITSARHIPTAACPTNDGPSAAWQARAAAQAQARLEWMNRRR